LFTSFDKFNENISVNYKTSTNEDRTTITAILNNAKIASVTSEVLFNSYEYEFNDVFSEEQFNEIFPDDDIIKIEHIEVFDEYKNKGIASELMKRIMNLMKKRGYTQFYLNACPLGYSGLELNDLVKFYEKFGFKILLNQGNNTLMGISENI
jgi:GNAT superfamily N-acetyltransferase